MPIICDTHALIFWAIAPERLSARAAAAIEDARPRRELACSDIVFWEMALLIEHGRLETPVAPAQFLNDLIRGMELTVLPISPEIALLSRSDRFPHKDPADRLIGATALHYHAPLVSADRQLAEVAGLRVIW